MGATDLIVGAAAAAHTPSPPPCMVFTSDLIRLRRLVALLVCSTYVYGLRSPSGVCHAYRTSRPPCYRPARSPHVLHMSYLFLEIEMSSLARYCMAAWGPAAGQRAGPPPYMPYMPYQVHAIHAHAYHRCHIMPFVRNTHKSAERGGLPLKREEVVDCVLDPKYIYQLTDLQRARTRSSE